MQDKDTDCPGEHRYFALEQIQVDLTPTKKVLIPLACTACGKLIVHEVDIQNWLK
jgi:hypothetical protein